VHRILALRKGNAKQSLNKTYFLKKVPVFVNLGCGSSRASRLDVCVFQRIGGGRVNTCIKYPISKRDRCRIANVKIYRYRYSSTPSTANLCRLSYPCPCCFHCNFKSHGVGGILSEKLKMCVIVIMKSNTQEKNDGLKQTILA